MRRRNFLKSSVALAAATELSSKKAVGYVPDPLKLSDSLDSPLLAVSNNTQSFNPRLFVPGMEK